MCPEGRREDAAQDSSFDIVAAVTAFIDDPSATSLELPAELTSEQKRQAKKLAEAYPDVKSQSFGMGADRRLHLFKQGRTPVRVKNTFIDDFVGDEFKQGDGAEPAVCRTLPDRFTREESEDVLSPLLQHVGAQRTPSKQQAPCDSALAEQQAPARPALDRSYTSTSMTSTRSGDQSVVSQPPLPEGFRFTVRDTFIHIEGGDGDTVAKERATQSMPDGSFHRHLEAERELRNRAQAAASTAAANAVAEASQAFQSMPQIPAPAIAEALSAGTEVTIEGLVKLPAFNGLTGTVDSLDEATNRYNVYLDAPAGAGGSRWAKVKLENLRLRMPPPPAHNAPEPLVDPDHLFDYGAGPGNGIPPTPKWEVDYDQQTSPLKLEALV